MFSQGYAEAQLGSAIRGRVIPISTWQKASKRQKKYSFVRSKDIIRLVQTSTRVDPDLKPALGNLRTSSC